MHGMTVRVAERPKPLSAGWKRARRELPSALDSLRQTYGASRYFPRFDPLDELISCILSQHGADITTFPTFTRLRAAYPDWGQLAAADLEDVKRVIQRAGLAGQKAKAIQAALRQCESTFGDFTLEPLRDWSTEAMVEWLRAIPGVGPKTVAIVACFALGRDLCPVDTHVERVVKRLGWAATTESAERVQTHLARVMPSGAAFATHNLLIQHGRLTCQAKAPRCPECSLRSICRWPKTERKRV